MLLIGFALSRRDKRSVEKNVSLLVASRTGREIDGVIGSTDLMCLTAHEKKFY